MIFHSVKNDFIHLIATGSDRRADYGYNIIRLAGKSFHKGIYDLCGNGERSSPPTCMNNSDDPLGCICKEYGHTICCFNANRNSRLIGYNGVELKGMVTDNIVNRMINNQDTISVNLIDHKKLFHIEIECGREDFPVLPDSFSFVSLARTEVQAGKIALTYSAPPCAKSVDQEIARVEHRSFQIFNGTFF